MSRAAVRVGIMPRRPWDNGKPNAHDVRRRVVSGICSRREQVFAAAFDFLMRRSLDVRRIDAVATDVQLFDVSAADWPVSAGLAGIVAW